MGGGQRQLKTLLRSKLLGSHERGFAMPLVFPVMLLLILGAVTLASRSTSSFLAASKQSDGQAARQAAESGMNRVLRALSPYGKNAGDPYLSFLLLSNWDDATKTWPLTQQGQAAIKARLAQCRISTRGMRESHVVPTTSQPYERLLSDVIGTATDGARTLRYRIVNYTPPVRSDDPAKPWPSECGDFATLSGGSAQITIEGWVEIDGKRMASQSLTRTIEVDPVPFPDLPDSMPVPGSPIGLRIAGTGTGLGSVNSYVYRNFETDANPELLGNSIGQLRPQCLNCSPALLNGVTKTPAPDPRDLPFPPFDLLTGNPLVFPGGNPKDLTLVSGQSPVVINASRVSDPSFNCKFTRNETEISCYIKDIIVDPPVPPVNFVSPYTPPVGRLRVDTSVYPVNLYIDGGVGGAAGKNGVLSEPSGPPPAPPAPQTFNDGRVVIEHCVKDCGTPNPAFYDHKNRKLRPLWDRLRIFGSKNNSQTFYIAARSPSAPSLTSLQGAFLWLPKGKLFYGNPTYTYDLITLSWNRTPETAPSEILASWWVENLDLTNLSGPMNFIMPLYGNPEAISAILPGGYFNAAGAFTQDFRFPVYPVLPRIRSSF